MADLDINVISDNEVVRFVHQEPGSFAVFLGAGASAEAGVPTAAGICDDILDRLKGQEIELGDVKRRLKWDDPKRRYSACLQEYGNEAARVEYFRRLLRGIRPAFSHHATALLMRSGILKRTCITTNFDKLIEVAFAQQDTECQPIRMNDEARFWRADAERYYAVKFHGDYDTNNILNTRDEIALAEPTLKSAILGPLLGDAGTIVIGAGGFEESVLQLFNEQLRVGLRLGLYWGVYVGRARPEKITDKEIKSMIADAIKDGAVSEDAVEMMSRGNQRNRPCAFFPVWGAGGFLFRLVKASPDRALVGTAELYLDHEMRLRNVFTKAGLSADAIDRHLKKLADQRKQMAVKRPSPAPEVVCTAMEAASRTAITVLYGDITSRTLMAAQTGRRAVLSAEDTSVSAGGGVAYSLLEKAGPQTILNELSKLAPIEQGDVAVTSGGDLPVEYIFHGAALKIEKDATYSVTQDDVSRTIDSAIRCADALGVKTILVPLIAAGVGPLTSLESFEAIVRSVVKSGPAVNGLRVMIVIYKESQLPRADIVTALQRVLPPDFVLTLPGAGV